jgi:hypothetical protein
MDSILKLHIAAMRFVQNRVDSFHRGMEEGFTTAELLGNAALGIGALVLIWTFFKTSFFDGVKNYIEDQTGIHFKH